ncbi:MAG: hypothetical protein AMJ43_05320 [Coxiella sp. DG_40]|nr:MAG: hypothetical protein AMJ43_05320 [Coxiella sp. DG_40]
MKIKLLLLTIVIYLICNSALAYSHDKQKNLEQRIKALEIQIKQLKKGKSLPTSQTYPYSPAVIASPYIGVRSAYDASDLITNFPTINEDLILLKQRQQWENYLKSTKQTIPTRPLIELSGFVEGQVLAGNKDYGDATTSDIDLSAAELDVLGEISSWATAYMTIDYDNSPFIPRYANSNVYLNRAFLTVGNLDKFPIYGTLGQIYIPFGAYNNYMITDPITKVMARTRQRAIVLGFSKSEAYASIYAFKGDSYSDSEKAINNGGINFGYKSKFQKTTTLDFGAGYINNIADSQGMQQTGAKNGFKGFSQQKKYEHLQHLVPAVDLHANLGHGPYNLAVEYIAALRKFSTCDLTFNNKGTQVSALDVQGNYSFHVINKPATLSAGYQQSWKALALNLPEHTIVASAGISLFRDTIEKIEYRHDINYKSSDNASGSSEAAYYPQNAHRARNVVIGQVDFYF